MTPAFLVTSALLAKLRRSARRLLCFLDVHEWQTRVERPWFAECAHCRCGTGCSP